MTTFNRWFFASLVVIVATALSTWSIPVPIYEPASFATRAKFSLYTTTRQYDKIEKMDLTGVNVGRALKVAARTGKDGALQNMLQYGTHSIDHVFDAKRVANANSESVRDSLNKAIDQHLVSLVKNNDIDKLKTLVDSHDKDFQRKVIHVAIENGNRDVFNSVTNVKDLVKANDVDTLRSLVNAGWVKHEDVVKVANENKSEKFLNAFAPKEQLDKYVANNEWKKVELMGDLSGIDVTNAIFKAAQRDERALFHLLRKLGEGSKISIQDLLSARELVNPDFNLIKLIQKRFQEVIDARLIQLIRDNKVEVLDSLVKNGIKAGHIYVLAKRSKNENVQNFFKARHEEEMRNEEQNKRERKQSWQVAEPLKRGIPVQSASIRENSALPPSDQENNPKSKVPLPKTVLRDNPLVVIRDHRLQFVAKELELNGEKYNPVKELGQGEDGQVVLYKNPTTKKEIAVKITRDQSKNSFTNAVKEETHLVRKAEYLLGKPAVREDGTVYTPMKVIQGVSYDKILKIPSYQDPDSLMKQVNAIDDAIKTLHDKGIEHRDLHNGNIMYDVQTNKASIIDFSRAASSVVTDENGKPFQLRPSGDREAFWRAMNEHAQDLRRKSVNPKNYNPLITNIENKLSHAKADQQWNAAQVQNLLKLKRAALTKLDSNLNQLRSSPKETEAYWKEMKQITKEKKQLLRELLQLESSTYVTRTSRINGKVETYLKAFDKETRSTYNEQFKMTHELFENAKLKLNEQNQKSNE